MKRECTQWPLAGCLPKVRCQGVSLGRTNRRGSKKKRFPKLLSRGCCFSSCFSACSVFFCVCVWGFFLNNGETLLNLTARFTRSRPLTSLPPSAAVLLVTDKEHWHDGGADGAQVALPRIHYGCTDGRAFRPGKLRHPEHCKRYPFTVVER